MWLSNGRGYVLEKAPAESREKFSLVGFGPQSRSGNNLGSLIMES